MTTALILLLALAVLANLAYVTSLVRHDGRSRHGRLPRSNYGDGFEPRRLA
jgi:hypothetical protein